MPKIRPPQKKNILWYFQKQARKSFKNLQCTTTMFICCNAVFKFLVFRFGATARLSSLHIWRNLYIPAYWSL